MTSGPGDARQAAGLLGWPGRVLPVMTLLGCRVMPVVALDQAVHQARQVGGDGPQLDGDTLAMWEWPESAGHVPATVVTLSGLLVPIRGTSGRAWRSGLVRARRWRGFGPAAVLADAEVLGDEVCRLEHALHGIGLVSTTPSTTYVPPVMAEPGRGARARRRTADRWIEELIYRTALDAGLFDPLGA